MLFTSSVASQMPGPYYASYAASKAFVQSFAWAPRYELKDTGVTVTALLPGPTDTEFFERADMEGTGVDSSSKDDPVDVARNGFEALMAGLSPARSPEQRAAIADAGSPRELIDPADEIDARRFPTLHRLAADLAQDHWEQEFETGLAHMLDRVASFVADGPGLGRG